MQQHRTYYNYSDKLALLKITPHPFGWFSLQSGGGHQGQTLSYREKQTTSPSPGQGSELHTKLCFSNNLDKEKPESK